MLLGSTGSSICESTRGTRAAKERSCRQGEKVRTSCAPSCLTTGDFHHWWNELPLINEMRRHHRAVGAVNQNYGKPQNPMRELLDNRAVFRLSIDGSTMRNKEANRTNKND